MSINKDNTTITSPAATVLGQVSNGPETGFVLPDAPLVDESRLSSTERERRARERQQQAMMTKEQAAAADLFAFLMVLFGGIKKDKEGEPQPVQDGLNDPQTQGKIADALGIDLSVFTRTVADVRTGKTSVYEAATRTHTIIDPPRVDWSKAADVKLGDLVRRDGPTLLNEDLLKKMQTDANVRQMVQWTFEAAEKHGLDAKLLANQYWQESGFNPMAKSGAGAKGVAQFMPGTGKGYGLHSDKDFYDPKKSIFAGAHHMADMTRKHGSQSLALVAYNGGSGAVHFAEKSLGRDVTVADWMGFMQRERETKGIVSADGKKLNNLWRVHSFEYVQKIDSAYWSPEKYAKAAAKQDSILREQFAMGGRDQTQKPPAGLTATHTHTVSTGGRTKPSESPVTTAGAPPTPTTTAPV